MTRPDRLERADSQDESDARRWDAWQRIKNGAQVTLGEYFVWLNAYGFGIGKLDHEGLGRGQFVTYWRCDK